jgi:hypothetical protein
MAWLVRPDGRQSGVPGLRDGNFEVYRGLSNSVTFPLLDRFFGADEAGAYQIHVRVFDDTTGGLLARASAGVEVCDSPSAVSGIVSGLVGLPILATVQALDILDATITSTAKVTPGGSYSMTVAPGQYLLQALVADSVGIRQVRPNTVLQVGCQTSNLTFDLSASVGSAGAAGGR